MYLHGRWAKVTSGGQMTWSKDWPTFMDAPGERQKPDDCEIRDGRGLNTEQAPCVKGTQAEAPHSSLFLQDARTDEDSADGEEQVNAVFAKSWSLPHQPPLQG
jgi:hypothetical protein